MATRKPPANEPRTTPGKAAVVDALRASLARDLEAVDAAAHAARDASTHPENKPENDKDTRAIEAGYLAGAQAARAAELKRTLHDVERADLRAFTLLALTEVVAGAETALLLLLSPWGGGQKVAVDGCKVQIVTPQSPLGAALKGKAAGDDVDVAVAGRVRSLSIISAW